MFSNTSFGNTWLFLLSYSVASKCATPSNLRPSSYTFCDLISRGPLSLYTFLPPDGVLPDPIFEHRVSNRHHSQLSGISNGISSSMQTGSLLPRFS